MLIESNVLPLHHAAAAHTYVSISVLPKAFAYIAPNVWNNLSFGIKIIHIIT